jgi:hypothetical protein
MTATPLKSTSSVRSKLYDYFNLSVFLEADRRLFTVLCCASVFITSFPANSVASVLFDKGAMENIPARNAYEKTEFFRPK